MTTAALSRIARAGVLIVALGAAILSYRATSHVAAVSGAVDSQWAWLAPVIIEASMVTSGCLAWVRVSTGERALAEIAMAATLLLLSVVVQVEDARLHSATALGMVLAATPPIVLLAAAEQLVREIRRVGRLAEQEAEAQRRAEERRATRTSRSAARPTDVGKPSEPGDEATLVFRPDEDLADLKVARQPDPDREVTRIIQQYGERVTGAIVAAELGRSPSQGRRRLDAWRKRQHEAADPGPSA